MNVIITLNINVHIMHSKKLNYEENNSLGTCGSYGCACNG